MRITLIYPSVGRKENTPYVRAWQMQPLSMALLAGLTPPDVEVRFYDDRMEDIPFDEPTDLWPPERRDIHGPAGVQDRPAVPRARCAGGHGRLSCYPPAGRGRAGSRRHRRRRRRAGLAASRSTMPAAGPSPTAIRWPGTPHAGGCPDLAARSSTASRIRTSPWSSSPAAATSSAISARSPRFHGANQNHRPAREVAAEMEATGSRRFFIVDDNIVSQPGNGPRAVPRADPTGINWVGQASIHIAQDDELLDLMVQQRLPRRADRHGVARPGQFARHGQELEPRRRQLCRRACGASARTAWRSMALSSSATTTTTARLIERSVDFRPRATALPGGVQPSGSLPGTPLYRRLKHEGRLLKPRWWLDPDSRVGDVNFRPREARTRGATGIVPGCPPPVLQLGLDLRSGWGTAGQIVGTWRCWASTSD